MQTQPSHHEIEELLGAYALDALDADEQALVTAHLPTCARCRAEVEEHREVAALLAHTGEPAPVGIWDRIAESLDDTPPELALPPAPAPSPFRAPVRPRARRNRSGSTAATRATAFLASAAAAVVIVMLAFQVQGLNRQVDTLERMAAVEAAERGFEQAAASDDTMRIQMASDEEQVESLAFLTPDGTGYLRIDTLPELPDERSYQLWGVTADERVVSLAVFDTSSRYAAFSYSGEYVAFAVSEEVEGGVVVSEQPPVVDGEV
jgi:anti-sigma-K factor RskA